MKHLIILCIFIGCSCLANSQSIRLERTDVDSARSGIVTASYLFGIDIYIDDLENVNSLTFGLQYTNATAIKFSTSQIGDFGITGQVILFPPNPNSNNSVETITVGVFSKNTLEMSTIDNPKMIHMEFAVLQTAPNQQDIIFTIINPVATAYVHQDTSCGVCNEFKLKSKATTYKIHSYVSVWPGDCDNNGVVDAADWTPISLYKGEAVSNNRRFKRKTSTTMWIPQTVLVWDEAVQTYVDCDGDGEITLSDALVVAQNLKKVVTGANKDVQIQSENIAPEVLVPVTDNSLVIPLKAGYLKPYSTINVKAEISNFDMIIDSYKFQGINSGQLFSKFSKAKISDFDQESGKFEFIISTFDDAQLVQNAGHYADLVFEGSKNSNNIKPEIKINEIKCMDASRNFFHLSTDATLKVDNELDENIIISGNSININNLNIVKNIKIIDITGITRLNIDDIKSNKIDLNSLENGTYFALISLNNQTSNNNVNTKKFIILK